MEVGPELRRGAVTGAGVDQGPDEDAVSIQRKHSYICIEILPVVSAHEKILLDVGCIESRYGRIVFAQVFTDGPKSSLSCEVSHHRHDQIVSFETLQCQEIVLSPEIASLCTVFIGIDHELFICGKNARHSRTIGKTDVA